MSVCLVVCLALCLCLSRLPLLPPPFKDGAPIACSCAAIDTVAASEATKVNAACRFLLISVREGTQPTNQLWYADLQSLPEFSKDKALDFTPYDYKSGPKALPLVKLVDNFEASYDYLANDGFDFTFQTNYEAPLYR